MTTLDEPLVSVVDDDYEVRKAMARLLHSAGRAVAVFASASEFLACDAADGPGCLVTDLRLPGVSGLDLLALLRAEGRQLPILFITGHGDVPTSVMAMKAGAVDFLCKPVEDADLLAAVDRAIAADAENRRLRESIGELRRRRALLTPRESEVFSLVVAGLLNKQIAGHLGTTEQTVKVHRGRVMQKMAAPSLADLVRFAERLETATGTAESLHH